MSFINATTDMKTLDDMRALSKYKEFINKLLNFDGDSFFACELELENVQGAIQWARNHCFITKKDTVECDIKNCYDDTITVELNEWFINRKTLQKWIETTISNGTVLFAWVKHDFPTCW